MDNAAYKHYTDLIASYNQETVQHAALRLQAIMFAAHAVAAEIPGLVAITAPDPTQPADHTPRHADDLTNALNQLDNLLEMAAKQREALHAYQQSLYAES